MSRMFSLLTALILVAAIPLQSALAQARDDHSSPDTKQQSTGNSSGDETPYAGRDLAYDYVTHEYYTYTGPDPKDSRAEGQDGYRAGVLHTQRIAYRSRAWYGRSGCGCAAYIDRYHSRSDHRSDEHYAGY